MALNPFFLQGSLNEQKLVQELINEHLKIYGIEVAYIPRKSVGKSKLLGFDDLREISSSSFDDNYFIEAYVQNYEGYSGSGDILTKFGMSLRDELTLVISKERYEDFISPFLVGLPEEEIVNSYRPKEGDLIYFPLGGRLFEIKFVEHENPFYQLGKNYVYELKCELFEYEDEVIDTGIDEIDRSIKDQGYITTLILSGVGQTATASASIVNGYVRKIFLNNDGYGYTSTPSVIFSEPLNGQRATAVAITTSKNNVFSISDILLTNAGFGYTIAPTITITGGNGVGAAATCSVEILSNGVGQISVDYQGSGYSTIPIVTVSDPTGSGNTATATASAVAVINNDDKVVSVRIVDPGSGYIDDESVTVTIANPPRINGIGTYIYNELVVGQNSKTTARVKSWDVDTNTLKVGINSGTFYEGEDIVGQKSLATFSISSYDKWDIYDPYTQNDEIQKIADQIVDFSSSNPFGNY